MQCSLQDGFATCLPHHRWVYEPVVANLQGRSPSRAVVGDPPHTKVVGRNKATLAPGNVRLPLLGFSPKLHYAFLHMFSIAKVAAETTVQRVP